MGTTLDRRTGSTLLSSTSYPFIRPRNLNTRPLTRTTPRRFSLDPHPQHPPSSTSPISHRPLIDQNPRLRNRTRPTLLRAAPLSSTRRRPPCTHILAKHPSHRQTSLDPETEPGDRSTSPNITSNRCRLSCSTSSSSSNRRTGQEGEHRRPDHPASSRCTPDRGACPGQEDRTRQEGLSSSSSRGWCRATR